MSQELITKIQELECLLEIEREKNSSSSTLISRVISENIELSAKLNFLNRRFNQMTAAHDGAVDKKKTEKQQAVQETEHQEDQEPKKDAIENNEVESSDSNVVITE